MEKTSRRLFLSVGPAAAVFGALAVAKSTESPQTMQALGVEFERLWAIERHANALGTDEEVSAACDACSAIVHRILAVPARTLDDFKVKGRALSWCYSGSDIGLFEDDKKTTDVKIVQSIVRDLLSI